jgi:NADH-quinone oxidoreductase subunit L
MFRLYAMTFLGEHRGDAHHAPHESPKAMTIPLIVLAFLSIVGGLVGIPELFMKDGHKLNNLLDPVFKSSQAYMHEHAHPSHETEWMLLAVSVALIIAVIIFAIRKFSKANADTESSGLGKVLENKWYVDEIYDAIIVKPVMAIGDMLNNVVEKSGIDKLVNGVGKGIHYSSRQLRLLQSGNVASYLLMMVISVMLLIWLVFYLKM